MSTDPIKDALDVALNTLKALVNNSGMQPNERDAINTGIDGALGGLINVAETAVTDLPNVIAAEVAQPGLAPIQAEAVKLAANGVPAVENAVGLAAEQAADAAITSVTGPFAPIAIEAANALMNAVGGKLEDAIAHLLHVGGAPASVAVATGAAVASTIVPPSPH